MRNMSSPDKIIADAGANQVSSFAQLQDDDGDDGKDIEIRVSYVDRTKTQNYASNPASFSLKPKLADEEQKEDQKETSPGDSPPAQVDPDLDNLLD